MLNVRYGFASLGQIADPTPESHPDFETFWLSARAGLEGEKGGSVYATGGACTNLNPPFFILSSVPLGLMDGITAYRALTLTMTAFMVGALSMVADEARMRTGLAAILVGGLLVSSPMRGTLALGQVYPVLVLGLAAAWVAERRGYQPASGVALGLVVALKPSLAPILLWPLLLRRWTALGAALASGAGATVVSVLVLGPRAMGEWLTLVRSHSSNPYWDNASLPAAAARLFTQTDSGTRIATLPLAVPVSQVVGLALITLTALLVWGLARRYPGAEQPSALWALVAASLLASPIAWHNYLLLLAPGILLLVVTGHGPLAFLLVALQMIPSQWPQLFQGPGLRRRRRP